MNEDDHGCAQSSWKAGQPYRVILFYRYVQIGDVHVLQQQLLQNCQQWGLLGRILVAIEGINGTVAGSIDCIEHFVQWMKKDVRFQAVDWKESTESTHTQNLPFLTLSVRIEKSLISCGQQEQFIAKHAAFDDQTFGGLVNTGVHLNPSDFHTGLSHLQHTGKGVLLDVRNQFEYDIGHFQAAEPLNVATYAESWSALDQLLTQKCADKNEPVYMYCTGGIRCEKASVYVKAKGYNNVYQLQGGIHRYLESYPDGGHFRGKNFVFDGRVSMTGAGGAKGGKAAVDAGGGVNEVSDVGAADADVDADTSGVDSDGEGVTEEGGEVVGRCLDCAEPFDQFSGRVVCTVCRLPVLVCPRCREERCEPGEYHCWRHR
jgi:predicted sulfurtransferase